MIIQSERTMTSKLDSATPFQQLNPISTGGGVFHINFVCLLITFLVLGRLPPNLVTFPKNYYSREA